MSLSNLSSLQMTIQNLKEIVDKNQGEKNETYLVVKQMEILVEEIERKARLKKTPETVLPLPVVAQPVQVIL